MPYAHHPENEGLAGLCHWLCAFLVHTLATFLGVLLAALVIAWQVKDSLSKVHP